jgi:translation initiation factor 1A
MPNQQGGKNYKKAKHGSGETMIRLEEAGPDELYGRVIKILGNLNMNVYCNDNKIRICKVRGSMRKRVWINIGDLVIISLRNLENELDKKAMTESDRKLIERGDIVHKIDPSLHSKAKKLGGINQKLFVALENADGKVLEELGTRNNAEYSQENDGGIEFDRGSDEEDEEEEGDSSEEETANVSKAKKTLKKAGEGKIAKAAREDNDTDLNIDDI